MGCFIINELHGSANPAVSWVVRCGVHCLLPTACYPQRATQECTACYTQESRAGCEVVLSATIWESAGFADPCNSLILKQPISL